jgi:hypothetical protein
LTTYEGGIYWRAPEILEDLYIGVDDEVDPMWFYRLAAAHVGRVENLIFVAGEVDGWRARCSCGWAGAIYSRSDFDSSTGAAPARVVNNALDDWREHLDELPAIKLYLAHRSVLDAQERFEWEVSMARRNGVTWAEVGSILGISRQSAHERFTRDSTP